MTLKSSKRRNLLMLIFISKSILSVLKESIEDSSLFF